MANEELVLAVKKIAATGREGKHDEAYAGWRALFQSPAFDTYDAPDQRQALRLMILAKGAPNPPPASTIEAHRAAIPALERLVAAHADPGDHELLGICYLAMGQPERASEVFRRGLTLERERDPSSNLCGSLMKRVSLI